MHLKTHEELHGDWMNDPEYKAAFEEEIRKERLREILAEWRSRQKLTSKDVAIRMGITPPTVAKMEKNITSVSLKTLYRYAQACGVENPSIQL